MRLRIQYVFLHMCGVNQFWIIVFFTAVKPANSILLCIELIQRPESSLRQFNPISHWFCSQRKAACPAGLSRAPAALRCLWITEEQQHSWLSAALFRPDAECLIDNNRKWQDRWGTSEGERVHECVFSPLGKSRSGWRLCERGTGDAEGRAVSLLVIHR